MDELLASLFGAPPDYSNALTPKQTEQMRSNALAQGGIGALIALLGASGPQARPVSTGQALAGALGAGFGGYQSSFDNTLKQMLTAQQLGENKQKQEARQRYQEALKAATSTQPVGIGLTQSGPGSQAQMLQEQTGEFGEAGALATVGALQSNPNLPMQEVIDPVMANRAAMDYVRRENPDRFLELTATKDATPAKVKEFEYAVRNDNYKGTFTDFIRSGTPSTNVNVALDKGIAAQIGPMLKDAQVQAQGANMQIDAADRVIQAVDSKKIIAGPAASPQLKLAQIGSVLGVTGKDTNETIANTRQVIRAFAELTLQGRKTMRGEGQITENEGKLAERAFSGDIDSLTPAEIKQIANASKRAAEFTVGEYNRKLKTLEKDPATAQLIPFYEVNRMPAATPTIKRFNPATGKVE
jgi:hypothetical protein